MKNLILGLAIGLLLPCIGGYLFIVSGAMPVSTKSPPLPFEKFIARKALHAAMKNEIDKPSPLEANEASLLQGAKIYRNQCAVCHGLPEQPKSFIAQGLFPRPPQLFKGHGVTDDPVGKTYWTVKNGVRLTGMPGFEGSLTDVEIWSVSLLLSKADKFPPSIKNALVQGKELIK